MKRILVCCIKDSEWYDYCKRMKDLADLSAGAIKLEVREEVMIEHYTNEIYLKVTPENFDNIPIMFKVASYDKIYLCDKDEWESLAILNKMGREAS